MRPAADEADRGHPRSALGLAYSGALAVVDRISYVLIVAITAAMTATVTGQVFYRYVLNDSIDWADEVSRLTFVWMIFLALPHGIRTGAHVGVDILVNVLSEGVRRSLFRLTSAIGVALFAIIIVQALRVAVAVWDQPMPTLALSTGMFYVALVVGSAHSMLVLAAFATGLEAEPRHVDEDA
jgi:TRAP-type C4-dicarboxylate transport system permease small subunit